MRRPLLELQGVAKAYPRTGVVAAAGVSFTVSPGEAVGLIGSSGAGKSTIGRLIAGLEQPDAGTIALDGTDLASLGRRARREARRRIHLVFQDPYASLAPHLRVADLVGEPLRIEGRAAGAAVVVAEALASVRLDPARYLARWPHELSGGERQRVALARALVGQPDLVVADEPTAMLDPRVRASLLGLMEDLRDRRRTSWLLITHDLAAASRFCRRLVVLDRGRVVETGTPEAVMSGPAHPATAVLVAAARRLGAATAAVRSEPVAVRAR